MKNTLRFFDRIIVVFLSIVGFTAACDDPVVEYGTPYADFEIKGTVVDNDSQTPIPNIRLIRVLNEDPFYGDTIYSDSEGKYQFSFNEIPEEENPVFEILAEDFDGEENGGSFQPDTVSITLQKSDWVEDGSGWYLGKAVKTEDIKLKKKN
ncbi:MAG: radical SAM-associated putative lipoprotein [Paludibacter sp.]|nr:radical SAM-associated putative lipoprotein [Paludibacter sp.]